MSAYLTGLISISALVGVCSYISYGEKQDKCLKAASSLILIYIVFSPAVTLIKDVVDFENYGESLSDYIESIGETELGKSAEESFCDGIKKYVCDQFSLSQDEIDVRVFGFDFEKMRAQKIKIILSGKAVFADNRAISDRVTKNGLGECEVELSVK